MGLKIPMSFFYSVQTGSDRNLEGGGGLQGKGEKEEGGGNSGGNCTANLLLSPANISGMKISFVKRGNNTVQGKEKNCHQPGGCKSAQ